MRLILIMAAQFLKIFCAVVLFVFISQNHPRVFQKVLEFSEIISARILPTIEEVVQGSRIMQLDGITQELQSQFGTKATAYFLIAIALNMIFNAIGWAIARLFGARSLKVLLRLEPDADDRSMFNRWG